MSKQCATVHFDGINRTNIHFFNFILEIKFLIGDKHRVRIMFSRQFPSVLQEDEKILTLYLVTTRTS